MIYDANINAFALMCKRFLKNVSAFALFNVLSPMANSTINGRIRVLIQHINLTDNAFAKTIGVTQSVISSMFQRNTEPSSKLITAILNTFQDVSAEWLLRGTGEMLISENKSDDKNQKRMDLMLDTMSSLQETINLKDKAIFDLESKIKRLENELAMLKNEINNKK